MNFIPSTEVRLLRNVPLYLNNKNSLWFDSITAQQQYFNSKPFIRYNNFTYQRKERQYIAVEENAEKLYNVNYLMFLNENFGSKWFYAFVTDIEYKNPNTSFVYYEIDVFQTWLFDLNFKESFVEREHQTRYRNGRPLVNTIDEGLNYGTSYKIVDDRSYNFYGDTIFILVTSKDYLHKLEDNQLSVRPSNIGNVPQGFYNYIFPVCLSGLAYYEYKNFSLMSWSDFYSKISNSTDLVGKVISLNILDYVPLNVVVDNTKRNILNMENVSLKNVRGDLGLTGSILYVEDGSFYSESINCGDKYSGFPDYKESKLLMYPYSYIKIMDFKGNEFDIKMEYVDGFILNVLVKGSISFQTKTSYQIQNYENDTNINNGLINNNVSSIPIIDDYTAAYLQGNQNSLLMGAAVNIGSSIVDAGVNTAVGNMGGALSSVGGGLLNILNLNAKIKDINNHPSNLRNQGNNYNFDYGNGYVGFRILKYTVMDEYARTLEDFFNMYGYKLNRIKIPNFHTRRYWNYIKTVDININANIPQDDLNKIKSMFDNGVTLWHTDEVGNYSLNNTEI